VGLSLKRDLDLDQFGGVVQSGTEEGDAAEADIMGQGGQPLRQTLRRGHREHRLFGGGLNGYGKVHPVAFELPGVPGIILHQVQQRNF